VPRPDEGVEDVPLTIAAPPESEAGGAAATPPATPAGDVQRRPCPKCGEMIVATAAKCRFCGELFDPGLRRARDERKDESLATGDYVLALLPCFSMIGCIVGIVYLIQGRPKGGKMIALSVGMTVIWSCLSGMMQGLQEQRRARRFSQNRPALVWHDVSGGLITTKDANDR